MPLYNSSFFLFYFPLYAYIPTFCSDTNFCGAPIPSNHNLTPRSQMLVGVGKIISIKNTAEFFSLLSSYIYHILYTLRPSIISIIHIIHNIHHSNIRTYLFQYKHKHSVIESCCRLKLYIGHHSHILFFVPWSRYS